MSINMDDYIDVAERIVEFRDRYPDGSLQPANLERPYTIEKIGEQTYIVVVAAAYRSPEDKLPGVGMAYEVFPGRTPYTKGSELQNAETSAWGRAIVAALAADAKRGIASVQEMRGRDEDTLIEPVKAARIELAATIKAVGVTPDEAERRFEADGHGDLKKSADVDAIRGLTAFYRKKAK